MTIQLRSAQDDDADEIFEVVEAAFGSRAEAELVRLIRKSPNYVPELSIVAVNNATIVGHVMLSYASIQDDQATHRVLTLSPVSVTPGAQRRGIGSSLIRHALDRADERGEPLVILEGSPAYYGRLGFTDARPFGIHFDLPDWAPPEAGQVYRLRAFNPAIKGRVVYPAAFSAIEALRHAAD